MGVPKKKTSHSRTHLRRAHDALSRSYAVICPNCGEAMQRFHACASCGQYRGKQIVEIEEKASE